MFFNYTRRAVLRMRRLPGRVRRTAVLVSVAGLLSACGLLPQISEGGSGGSQASAVWRDDVRLTVEGVLAEADPPRDTVPQCPVVVLDDGRIYALVGDLDGVGLGDRIAVTGPPAAWSTCQTYQVLRADAVETIQVWSPR